MSDTETSATPETAIPEDTPETPAEERLVLPETKFKALRPPPPPKPPVMQAPNPKPPEAPQAPEPETKDEKRHRVQACGEAIGEACNRFRCQIVPTIGEQEPVGFDGSKVMLTATFAIRPLPLT